MEYTNPIGLALTVPLHLQGTETTASLAIQSPERPNDVFFLSYLYGPGADLASEEVADSYEAWLREGLGAIGPRKERVEIPGGVAVFYERAPETPGSVVAWSLRSIGDLAAGLVGISGGETFERDDFLALSKSLAPAPRSNPENLSHDWKWSESNTDSMAGFSMAIERTYRLAPDGSFSSWGRAIGGTAAVGLDSGTEVDTVGVWAGDDRRLILLTNSSITAWDYYQQDGSMLLTDEQGGKTLWRG